MKQILWISRHLMTEDQLNDLKRIYGNEITIMQYDKTLLAISEIKNQIEQVDIIAAVLPSELLCELLKVANGKPVIQSVSNRVLTGKYINGVGGPEKEYKFVHKYWQQLVQAQLEFQVL